jgi:manganese/iron transport system substrate-binding protein
MNNPFKKVEPLPRLSWFLTLLSLSLIFLSAARAETVSKPKRIVTSFTILADITKNITGSAAVVESITKPGAEIHEYDPTPRDVVKAQAADLVIYNGMNLELWFEKFYGEVKGVPRVIATEGIRPQGITRGPYTGKPNPHTWMSPANVIIYTNNICNALVKLDPENESIYRRNAKAYIEELQAVDLFLKTKLEEIPLEQRWLVSSEGAFSYLTSDYGMREAYIWPINSDEEGSPQQIKELVDLMRTNKIPANFSESTISDKPARQVAKESGAAYGGVLYVDSLTDANGVAPTLLKLLRYNAETIVTGLGGKKQ